MNNIGAANIVILKQCIIKEVDNNLEDHIYPVTAATQSQRNNLETKKFQLISQIIKPAGKNSEKLPTH